jgi:hypothetical protein
VELDENAEAVRMLRGHARCGKVMLVYAAKAAD